MAAMITLADPSIACAAATTARATASASSADRDWPRHPAISLVLTSEALYLLSTRTNRRKRKFGAEDPAGVRRGHTSEAQESLVRDAQGLLRSTTSCGL
jgi:hypothetical protein